MSGRITQSILYATALRNIHGATARTVELQNKIASGKRVNKPSDDPAAAMRILPLHGELRDLSNSVDLLEVARQSVDASSSSLIDASSSVQRLREITVQAANSTVSESDRKSMAAEVEQILQRLLASANGKLGSKFVFGGTESTRAPFDLIEDGGGTRVRYRGGATPAAIQTPMGIRVETGIAGDKVYLAHQRQATTFEGTTGAAPSGAADNGVGFGELQVTFAGLSVPSTVTGLAQGDDSTTALGSVDYAFTAGAPPTLSLNGGPAQAITGGVQTFAVGSGSDTISLDVTTPISPATGTLQSEAFLSTDSGSSLTRVTDFSGATDYQVRNSYDGTVLNVDVSNMDRIGTERVKFNGTFDVFTTAIEIRDLLENEDGLPSSTVEQRLTDMIGEVDFSHRAVLAGMQDLGGRAQNMSLLSSRFENLQLSRQGDLSLLEDTELAETVLQLQQQNVTFQASLQVGARSIQTSLLAFLG